MKRRGIFYWGIRVVGVLLLAGGVVALLLYRQARRDPHWYPRRETDPAVLEKAAARVENTLIELRNWAGAWAAVDARAVKGSSGHSGPRGMPPPAPQFTAVIRGEELTAFVLKWTKLQGWDAEYEKWVEDPAIAIVDGRIVVVGRVRDAGAAVSLHYRPELLEGGKMAFHLEKVMLGRLPVPASVGQEQLERTSGALAKAMSKWSGDAKVGTSGLGNNAAVMLSVGNAARGLVGDVPVVDGIFVPVTDKGALPVEITKLEVGESELRVTIRPVERSDRPAFLGRLAKAE